MATEPTPTQIPESVEGAVRLSVIVPVYNERGNIEPLVKELEDVLTGFPGGYEILFIDDGSADGTRERLRTIVSDPNRHVRAVLFRRNFGKGAAYSAGFRFARGELVATMDGDLQDDPHDLFKLISRLEEGYDLVNGWRTRRQDAPLKGLVSQFFNTLARRGLGLEVHDVNCPLRVMGSSVARSLGVRGDVFRFIPLLVLRRGYRVTEVEVTHRRRRSGRSKFGWRKFFRAPLDLLTVLYLAKYMDQPIHLMGGWGLILSGAGVLIELYLTYRAFVLGDRYGNHLPLFMLGILLIIFGIQLVLVGLAVEIFSRLTTGDESTYDIEAVLS